MAPASGDAAMMMSGGGAEKGGGDGRSASDRELIERVQQRMRDYVQRPASVSLGSIVYLEVTVAADRIFNLLATPEEALADVQAAGSGTAWECLTRAGGKLRFV